MGPAEVEAVKLTDVELAQCGDAMRIAGVPESIVGHLLGLETRRRVIGSIWEEARPLIPGVSGTTISDRHRRAYQSAALEIAQQVVWSNFVTVSPPITSFYAYRYELQLEVLTPIGWKPPVKVPR